MNKIDLIVAVIEQSSSFTCNHVTYEVKGENIFVRSTSEFNTFNSTDLIGTLDKLCNCFLTIIEGQIVLKCF